MNLSITQKQSYRYRQQTYCNQGVSEGRDKLGDWIDMYTYIHKTTYTTIHKTDN